MIDRVLPGDLDAAPANRLPRRSERLRRSPAGLRARGDTTG
ncbi:hypothetical protein ACIQM3_33995 [Streptomyces sp. NPDC091271]